jgi:hypothetical protein
MEFWNTEADRRRVECVHLGDRELRPEDRLCLRPRNRADIVDMALDGMTATITTIEQDFEGRIHLAVTVDDDPGRDLGDDAFGVEVVQRLLRRPTPAVPPRSFKTVRFPPRTRPRMGKGLVDRGQRGGDFLPRRAPSPPTPPAMATACRTSAAGVLKPDRPRGNFLVRSSPAYPGL